MLRQIEPLKFTDPPVPAELTAPVPEFMWVAPTDIWVDEAYQRSPSKRSLAMVRRVVETWDWTKFKPPVVVYNLHDDNVLLVAVDGQHTAYAAATHGGLPKIPVMVVRAESIADQAKAFVGQNENGVAVTAMQRHKAKVLYGDETALEVERVCKRAGVGLVEQRQPGTWAVGETVAIQAVTALVDQKGPQAARRVLDILVKAGCAPIMSDEIKAVQTLLFADEFRGEITEAAITSALRDRGEDVRIEAAAFAVKHKVRGWKSLATAIYQDSVRGRPA